jgi:hypothetical protein
LLCGTGASGGAGSGWPARARPLPAVACAGNGLCLVTWEWQAALGASGWDVAARRVNQAGTVGAALAIYGKKPESGPASLDLALAAGVRR